MTKTPNKKGCLSKTTFRLVVVLLVTSALALGFLFFFRSCLGMSAVDRLQVLENQVNRLENEVEDCKGATKDQRGRRLHK